MNFIKKISFIFLLSSFIFSCAPTGSAATPQLVTVYATDAAQPWLTELYACAADLGAALNVSADSPEIFLRLGEPADLSAPAFQIGTEDLVVVVNYARPPVLNADQIKGLFTGAITNFDQITAEWRKAHSTQSGEVHVWAYASSVDIQTIFEQAMLSGKPVTSQARLAVNPKDMLSNIAGDESAIGFLPRRWLGDGVFEEAVAASAPVLAITPSEPQGVVRDLIACLQR
jgi:hypothetical protein